MSPPRVSLHEVRKSYRTGFLWRAREQQVLDGIDMTLGEGEALTIHGENGVGKSTLLRLVAGLLTPESGTVHIDGERPDESPRARARVGYASGDERSLFQKL